jgi:hypothetical protein
VGAQALEDFPTEQLQHLEGDMHTVTYLEILKQRDAQSKITREEFEES